MKVEFFRHNIEDSDIARVERVLRSIFLTTGAEVKSFEEKLAAYLDVGHAVGLTSCTAGLHLALLALGVGPGHEVITTPLTFMATANTIVHVGAKPVFVDVEPETGNIDARLIEKAITPRTKAIMPVHLYGQMCDMLAIRKIADRYGLFIIEDSAHTIEGIRDGIKPGQLGDAACFSFYATKNITCGEGGAVVTNCAAMAEKIKLLRQHGMTKNAAERYTTHYEHYDMELCGWKYNMDNIQAALLIGQLERIEKLLARREEIAYLYEKAFDGFPGLKFPAKVAANSRSARHLFTIWVDPLKRDQVLKKLQEEGIGVAVNFRPVHLMKYYRENYGFSPGLLPVAEQIGQSTVSLPLYPRMTDEEVHYVIKAVKNILVKG